MAFELYGMLAGNVSPLTGEPVKPAYGGDNEAFLMKVVKPIYDTIAKVWFLHFLWNTELILFSLNAYYFVSLLSNFMHCRKPKGVREENQSILNGETMMI